MVVIELALDLHIENSDPDCGFHSKQLRFGLVAELCRSFGPKRKHVRNGVLSLVDFENGQIKVKQEGV